MGYCIGLEPRPLGSGNQPLLCRRIAAERRQTLLVVLIGFVGEATDQREATQPRGTARKGAAGTCTKDQRAEAAECRAGTQLVISDQIFELSDKFVGRLPRRLPDGIASTSGSTCRFIETACAFAHARGCLSQHLFQNVEHGGWTTLATLASFTNHSVGGARTAPAEKIAQHVLKIAAARTLPAASSRPAAAQNVTQHIFETAAAGAATGGAARLSAAAKDIAQNVFDPAAAGLTRWRCRGVVVVFVLLWAAAAREGLRFVRLFLLRWQGAISALRTTLAAELTQQIPEDIRSLSLALSLRLSAATNERVENASGVEHRRDPPKGGSPPLAH